MLLEVSRDPRFDLQKRRITGIGSSREVRSDIHSFEVIFFEGYLGSVSGISATMYAVLDPTVLAVTTLLGIEPTLLFGLLPAMRLSVLDPVAWFRDREAGSGAPRLTVGRIVIALQIAVWQVMALSTPRAMLQLGSAYRGSPGARLPGDRPVLWAPDVATLAASAGRAAPTCHSAWSS